MKQLLYLVASLIVIAAIIPAASAYEFHSGSWSTVNSYYGHPVTYLARTPLDSETWWVTGSPGTLQAVMVNDTGYARLSEIRFRAATYSTTWTVQGWNGTAYHAIGVVPICYGDPRVDINGMTEFTFYYRGKEKFNKIGFFSNSSMSSGALAWVEMWWEEAEDEPNFSGSPLTGSAPLAVGFTATNTTTPTNLSWSFGDGAVEASTSTTINHTYQSPGIYTVRMDYTNFSETSKSIQKNDYIIVGAFNATKTKWFQTIDGTNGNIVLNSSIQLNDVENSSWVNATGLTADGMSSITTLEGHTIDAYAQSLGYSDADDLGILNDGQPQYIMMWPTFAKSVSEGNVSLYVTVKDKDTKANIVGAGVTASLASGSQSTTTNEAGIAYFVVKNSSVVLITAQAIGQGYQTATTTINTGTTSGGSASAAATILLGKNTVIPTFTTSVTTLPGGGTPTPVVTILPGCEDTISAAGQEKCRAAQSNQGLSFLSGNLLGLIQICFVVTILYLLGIKLGK